MNQIEIGKFIAELRKEKGITQSQLGEMIGVTNKTISRWENGNYAPDISVIPLLCEGLGVSVNELFSGRRLNDADFRRNAENNLISSLKQIESFRKEKKLIEFFGGAGTGLVVSAIWSPGSVRRIIVAIVGLIMIGISWYRRSQLDLYVIKELDVVQ